MSQRTILCCVVREEAELSLLVVKTTYKYGQLPFLRREHCLLHTLFALLQHRQHNTLHWRLTCI
jgi:hypothetical protein